MTICRYYIQGNCRFGDRCRFEHVDPEDRYNNSNRGQDYGYQDRYRQQIGNQGRYNNHQDQELSFGPRRYENYERRDNWQDRNNQRNNSEKYYSSQRYTGSEKQSAYNRFDNSNKQSQYKSDYQSNKYERNQYEYVSEDYKKRQQVQQNRTVLMNRNSDSIHNFSFRDSSVYEKENEISEETLFLTEMIKEDMTAWELGKQWPFTCYNPFAKKEGIPGFNDVSFEELRYEALQAQENNSFDSYIENVDKLMLDVQNRRNLLKEPTSQLISLIEKLRQGESIENEFEIGGNSPQLTLSQPAIDDMLAEESSLLTENSAASFSFKTIPEQVPSEKNSASSFSFKSIFDKDTPAKSGNTSFSFKLPANEKLPGTSLASKIESADSNIYTAMDQLSVQDREQFTATTFTLGKIPTVPPPKVLCF